MGAKIPYAWFPATGHALISRRKVDKWAVRQAKYRPYFPTWAEAHSWMQQKAIAELACAAKKLDSSRKHLERVLALSPPADSEEGG